MNAEDVLRDIALALRDPEDRAELVGALAVEHGTDRAAEILTALDELAPPRPSEPDPPPWAGLLLWSLHRIGDERVLVQFTTPDERWPPSIVLRPGPPVGYPLGYEWRVYDPMTKQLVRTLAVDAQGVSSQVEHLPTGL